MQTSTILGALQIIQVIICIALVVSIMFQAQGMGGLFGGDVGMGITKTRRGLEKTLFQITIILAALFLVNSVVQLMLSPRIGS
jgi:preprotein translocase subunit SecG